ncbi:MAG TPA: 3-deoxy-8-phosphooctulonate synthase [Armatimonadetes bacterium]|nr:3-deoxy-8-phosphooctulonate synthase [Armatimonadota bacterium]
MGVQAAVRVGDVWFGGGHPLALIAGPCVIESREHCLQVARRLREICAEVGLPLVFKASYDKANRTSGRSFRGPGLEAGLPILAAVREEVGLPVTTDVHETADVSRVAAVVDLVQIPAFLSRQTDLLTAAARTGKPVNVKKGQFLAPWDLRYVVEKIADAGGTQVLLTERGTVFGYHNLVVDFRSLPILRNLGVPVIFDATHSVQLPGGRGGASGGQREFVAPLLRAAVAVGVEGIFLEVHDNPEVAPCDGPNMVPLESLPELLRTVKRIHESVKRDA